MESNVQFKYENALLLSSVLYYSLRLCKCNALLRIMYVITRYDNVNIGYDYVLTCND